MRILIAEDAALFREGLRLLLESADFEVVGQVSSASDLLPTVRAIDRLDLLITDVRMPPHRGNDGIQAAVEVRKILPRLPIMVLSQYVADAYAMQWLRASNELITPTGIGYLLKESVGDVDDFSRAVQTVADGGVVFDSTVIRSLLRPVTNHPNQGFSPREREALALMARGMSNAEIAAKMHLSIAGVTKHISRVFDKMELEQETGNRRVLAVLKHLEDNR